MRSPTARAALLLDNGSGGGLDALSPFDRPALSSPESSNLFIGVGGAAGRPRSGHFSVSVRSAAGAGVSVGAGSGGWYGSAARGSPGAPPAATLSARPQSPLPPPLHSGQQASGDASSAAAAVRELQPPPAQAAATAAAAAQWPPPISSERHFLRWPSAGALESAAPVGVAAAVTAGAAAAAAAAAAAVADAAAAAAADLRRQSLMPSPASLHALAGTHWLARPPSVRSEEVNRASPPLPATSAEALFSALPSASALADASDGAHMHEDTTSPADVGGGTVVAAPSTSPALSPAAMFLQPPTPIRVSAAGPVCLPAAAADAALMPAEPMALPRAQAALVIATRAGGGVLLGRAARVVPAGHAAVAGTSGLQAGRPRSFSDIGVQQLARQLQGQKTLSWAHHHFALPSPPALGAAASPVPVAPVSAPVLAPVLPASALAQAPAAPLSAPALLPPPSAETPRLASFFDSAPKRPRDAAGDDGDAAAAAPSGGGGGGSGAAPPVKRLRAMTADASARGHSSDSDAPQAAAGSLAAPSGGRGGLAGLTVALRDDEAAAQTAPLAVRYALSVACDDDTEVGVGDAGGAGGSGSGSSSCGCGRAGDGLVALLVQRFSGRSLPRECAVAATAAAAPRGLHLVRVSRAPPAPRAAATATAAAAAPHSQAAEPLTADQLTASHARIHYLLRRISGASAVLRLAGSGGVGGEGMEPPGRSEAARAAAADLLTAAVSAALRPLAAVAAVDIGGGELELGLGLVAYPEAALLLPAPDAPAPPPAAGSSALTRRAASLSRYFGGPQLAGAWRLGVGVGVGAGTGACAGAGAAAGLAGGRVAGSAALRQAPPLPTSENLPVSSSSLAAPQQAPPAQGALPPPQLQPLPRTLHEAWLAWLAGKAAAQRYPRAGTERADALLQTLLGGAT